ncbi:MAG: phosphodiester glycosidase family protein [Clostridiales bacterium]|jgi:hypothetical protein|nr:phosphodiester glycosidase family protein [Clostridiales bacterium]
MTEKGINGDSPVSLGGETNYADWSNKDNPIKPMDALYYVAGAGCEVVRKKGIRSNLPAVVQWAIGGVDVFQTQSIVNGYNVGGPDASDARTGIGVRSNGDVVLIAAYGVTGAGATGSKINGPTVYQMRAILEYCGCVKGLCLDGSYSTMVSYKNGSGAVRGYGMLDGSDYRPIPTCIRLSEAAFSAMTNASWVIEDSIAQ